MNKNVLCLLLTFGILPGKAQVKIETQNVILITLDGFRWQELFRGADPALLNNRKFVGLPDSMNQFTATDFASGRNKLLPFFWNTIASQGQLYGNRDLKNKMDCSNPYWFSYPGYHEMLVGAVDRKVCSNLKLNNPNGTVLGFVNKQSDFINSVAAFSTWDVFPYILSESGSGIPVNKGIEEWNDCKSNDRKRDDSTTFYSAFEYLKHKRPKVLYIAFDETDYYAHHDRYDHYLLAAHQSDRRIAMLWKWLQLDPGYAGRTTLLITTDHGRGQNSKKSWRHHGRFTRGSGQIWMAALGPDTPMDGEMKGPSQLYQKQIAKTLAALLGLNYENTMEVGSAIQTLIKTPELVADRNKRPEFNAEIRGNR